MTNEHMHRGHLLVAASIAFAAVLLSGTWIYVAGRGSGGAAGADAAAARADAATEARLVAEILPAEGIGLPATWQGIGRQLVENGTIDRTKFEALYAERGGVPADIAAALDGSDDRVTITTENSSALLNVLWALGLAQKSPVLEEGPMTDPEYGGAGNFASTGGWTLARGEAMDHYSAHTLLALSPEAQEKVARVAQGIYRPCCGNSTYFPDCNHGMAMLGLLELMAAQDVSEEDMWAAALAVNRFWFPDTYLNAAKYIAAEGGDWKETEPRVLLGAQFSSGQGAAAVQAAVQPSEQRGGGSCGV